MLPASGMALSYRCWIASCPGFWLRESTLSTPQKSTVAKLMIVPVLGWWKADTGWQRPAHLSVSKAAKDMLKFSIKLYFWVRRKGAVVTVTCCSLRVRLNMLPFRLHKILSIWSHLDTQVYSPWSWKHPLWILKHIVFISTKYNYDWCKRGYIFKAFFGY